VPIRLLLPLPLLGLLLAAQAPTAPAPATTPAAREAIQAAAGRALQGDMTEALVALRAIPAEQFAGPAAALRTCILDRFAGAAHGDPPTGLPPLTTGALGLYRAYWRAALLAPASRPAGEEALRRGLAALLGAAPSATMDALETRLSARLEAEGVHTLTGVTAPLRELMLWRRQTAEDRAVALPEGVHRSHVVLLDDFVSFGWAGYATCDRSITGGWVRPDGIYAVRPGWGDLSDEPYLVSFLGHESQHFADKERFGDLPSWVLEYRAKLTELALADRTQARLLDAFAHNQGDDMAIPHAFANKRVLAALRGRLGLAPDASLDGVAPAAIRAAAIAELRADSARRHPLRRPPAPRR
jgi:hypothetical protein